MNRCAYLLLLLVLLTACSGGVPKQVIAVNVEQIWAHGQCGFTEQSARVIGDESTFNRSYLQLYRDHGARNVIDINQLNGKKSADLPQVDWRNKVVLLLAMGQKPSAGYAVSLAKSEPVINDKVLSIEVNWQEPTVDSFQAQLIMSPCVLLVVQRHGYRHISVVDHDDPSIQRWRILP